MNPSGSQLEQLLLAVLIQLIVILGAARFFGVLFRRFGQPQVCGEIAAGLILGPSLFGRLFPYLFHSVFNPRVGLVFSMVSQIGLVLLLFLIGLEFDFSHLRTHAKKALSISVAGIALPFALGLVTARILYPYVGKGIDERGFALFLATAISITALPILGRVLIEFNLNRTRLATLALTAAAVDDAAGWTILATVTAIVKSNFRPLQSAIMVVEIAGYASVMMLVVRPLLLRWIAHIRHKHKMELTLTHLAILLVIIFLSAVITNLIGIFSIFGGFIVGAILYDQADFRAAVAQRMRDFTTVFFLPIFFTYTGLRTDIGTMQGNHVWLLGGLVLATAVVGKFGGCALAARLSGFSTEDSCAMGVLMNTRALMDLVVVNIGLDFGLIPRSVFFMLVMMAVITTYMTAPLLRQLLRSVELRSAFQQSEFMRERRKMKPALERAS
jgi:Kef-type K+ transport system membrane component KefB